MNYLNIDEYEFNHYDSDTLVAKYAYDAFGNCTILQNNSDNIADINPFRYRGYYYDIESGLYYLKARYYDPTIGRFISPDGVEYLEPDNVLGLNLYAYCYNNPIGIAYSSSGAGFSTSGKMMSSLAISGSIIPGYGSSNKGFYWPNLDFLGTGFGYIENSFSMIAGVIDGVRKIKHLDKLAGLDKVSKWLMRMGIGINVGLSLYNNLTNSNLSGAQKEGNIVGDIVYIAASSAATWGVSALTTMIPVVG
ncbi:MAG: RHS repeat-associated core domain-containing protein, partial [Clostridia bacterium]|nr:RHS repeat-associated core domain-containing protein [Clostridia bacterium]